MSALNTYLELALDFLVNFQAGRLTNVSAALVPIAQLLAAFGVITPEQRDLIVTIASGGIGAGIIRKPIRSALSDPAN